MRDSDSREKRIFRVSLVGIACNILLAVVKAVIGAATGSIAIITDALNNLSDVLSSVVTILGARYASKKPDKEHPLGHGRAEYLSAAVISLIVLYAGLTAFVESIRKIIDPGQLSYTWTGNVILMIAVVVKVFLSKFYNYMGMRLRSEALTDSGKDAGNDVLLSLATIAAAFAYMGANLSIEGYVGIFIGVIIIKSGIEMMSHTVAIILGQRPDPELTKGISYLVNDIDGVEGVYDLILHNYGPGRYTGSMHVEINDTMSACEIDDLEREISHRVYSQYGVIIEAVGIYSRDTMHPEISEMHSKISDIVYGHEHVLQMHGFRVDLNKKIIYADIIISFDEPDRDALYKHIRDDIWHEYPDMEIKLVLDVDASDQE